MASKLLFCNLLIISYLPLIENLAKHALNKRLITVYDVEGP